MKAKYKRIGRSFSGMAFALTLLLTLVAGIDSVAYAQETSTPTATPTRNTTATGTVVSTATVTAIETATATSTRRAISTRPAATATPSATLTITATQSTTEEAPVVPVTVTVVVTVTSVATATATPTPTAGATVVELQETEVLTGTILANRTEVTTTFFLEGQLYELPPLRSTSAVLQRPVTVLTLYNCEVGNAAPSSEAGSECFWDPYPVRQDGFYEIVNGADVDAALSLLLQEAAPPPDDQIWIQNRTGHPERFLYADNLFELANSNVLELTLDEAEVVGNVPVGEIYLRRCLGVEERAVCEWLPQQVVGGIYYALIDETAPGLLPNSAVTTIQLDLVLGEERLAALATPTPEPTPTPAPTEAPPTPDPIQALVTTGDAVICTTQVPRLNVRSGPGVEYLVVAQVQQETDDGRFVAIGQNAAGDWLAVDPSVADGGWVINTPQFVICEGETDALAVTPVTDGRLAEPTAVPATADSNAGEGAEGETTDAEAGAEAEETAAPVEAGIPIGQARLIATNAFDQDIRFTLAANEHGLPEGSPSEYDLAPGESVSFIIRAGRVQFSASSPFRSSSGNAEFFIEEGTARELFLRFFPAEGDPNRWELQWE